MDKTGKKTVLVVDDNEMNLKLFRSILKITPYSILEAMDAKTGIEMARTHQPDMILMDIQLPGMDGFSATKILREDTRMKSIPILAITGNTNIPDEMKSYFNDFVFKPFNLKNFIEKLDHYLKETP
jgi:two-component system, cell cycle response regulator DivK